MNVGSLLALWAIRYIKTYPLVFLEAFITAFSDCGEVCEKIATAVIWSNKAEAL